MKHRKTAPQRRDVEIINAHPNIGLTRRQVFNRKVNDACNAAGYSEAKTLSFLSPKAFDKICLAENDVRRQAVVITNPLGEDQSLLRTTALPAMLEAAARNYNFRAPAIHLFEQSKIYLPKLDENGKTDPHQLPEERSVLVMATYSEDFFHLKEAAAIFGGQAEELFETWDIPGRYLVYGDPGDLDGITMSVSVHDPNPLT